MKSSCKLPKKFAPVPEALNCITDVVLAYRPKAATPKQKKRKRKAKKLAKQ